jgi:hypothetical protein
MVAGKKESRDKKAFVSSDTVSKACRRGKIEHPLEARLKTSRTLRLQNLHQL